MPSAPADRRFLAGRPLWWVAGLVICLVLAGVGYVVSHRPTDAVIPAAGPGLAHSGPAAREAAATTLLERLTTDLRHGTRQQVVALAAPGDPAASRELAQVFANVRRIGLTGLTMRYIDEQTDRLGPAQQDRLHGHGYVADVELSWRVRGYDRGTAHHEITLTFEKTPHGAAYVTARSAFGDPAPLWLLAPLRVQKSPESMVELAGPGSLRRLGILARRAVVAVHKVLPGWRGKLVVEAPASQSQLDRVLHAPAHSYDAIAAVTTTVDGSLSASAPVHVFLNPPVFDPLGPNGAQIVMSHETTHVATGAAISSMPTWLLEGFADFVALDHVSLPVSLTAAQILARVRRHGPPAHLPGAAAFASSDRALGAQYEAAWLACRLIGARYGEQKLIRFYRESNRDSSTARAFRDVLGTDQAAFTRTWRAYLRQLA